MVMAKGTVLHTYRESTPGRTSSGLRDSCHMMPNSEAPASNIQGLHNEKKTRAQVGREAKAEDPQAHPAHHLITSQGDAEKAVGQAEESPDGQAGEQTQGIATCGLSGDKGCGAAEQHQPFEAHVEHARALADQFAQRRKEEDG